MTTIHQEKELIEDILNGSTSAFSQIVDAYKHMVFTLVIRMVKNREEAEEVSQDVFIKVFKSLSQFKFDSKLSTWIYKIAYYSSLDSLKKNKKFLNNQSIDDGNYNQIASLDNTLEALITEERRSLIRTCVNELPSDSAALITLFYFEELSLEEIAEVTGLSANTAKVKLHRARKVLYKILEQQTVLQNSMNYGTG